MRPPLSAVLDPEDTALAGRTPIRAGAGLVVAGGGQDGHGQQDPRAAVAVSGIVYGGGKPDAAACGADVTPISNAAQPAQRGRPGIRARSARSARPRPARPRPARRPGAGCRAVIRTRPQRVRSRAAAASSMTAIRRSRAGCPGRCRRPLSASAAAMSQGRRLFISRRSRRALAAAGAVPAARSAAVIWPCRAVSRAGGRPSPGSPVVEGLHQHGPVRRRQVLEGGGNEFPVQDLVQPRTSGHPRPASSGHPAPACTVTGRARAARSASISRLRATRNSQGRTGRSSALSCGR